MDWRDVSKGDGGMSLDEWFAFARDFNLGPGTNRVDSGPLSRAAVAASFREANHGRGSDDDEDALSFDEFRGARQVRRARLLRRNERESERESERLGLSLVAGRDLRGMVAPRIARRDASSGRVRSASSTSPRGKNTRRNASPERRRVFVRVFSRVVLVGVVAVARSGVRARAGASSRAKLRVQGVARARLADADQVRRRVSGAVLSRRRAPRGVSLGDGGYGS